MTEQLQRSVFKWVQAADDEARGHQGPVKAHAMISAQEVAKNYGVPEGKLRSYIRHEIEEEASCRALPFTFVMLWSYTAVVLWHDPVVPINDMEDSIAFDIEENANFAFSNELVGAKAIYDVNSAIDFWSWMIQGFVPLVWIQETGFAESRDPEDPEVQAAHRMYPRQKRGYFLNYNKIIGGIRIRQERFETQQCESLEDLHGFYGKPCMGSMDGGTYELYPEKSTAKYTDAVQSSEFWLWINDDSDDILAILRQKEKDGWIDANTKKIEVTMAAFNGNLGVYTICYSDFFFSRGGHIWKRVLPMSTYSEWWHAWYNILPDILWMIGLLSIFLTEVFSIIQTLVAKTGGGCRGIWHEYLSFWNIVDWATVMGGFWIITGFGLRFAATDLINQELNTLSLFDEENNRAGFRAQSQVVFDVLAEEVLAANDFRIILGTYPMLIVMRLFEAFSHQPRLSIVTSTLGDAMVDLVHFLLVFMSIFVTYAIAGVVLFGREVDGFTNTSRSVNTCFRIMMGDFDWEEMLAVGRMEAGFWFSTFIVIIVLLMLNMLLAIVMDAYSEQKAALGEAETLGEEFRQGIIRWQGERSGSLRSLKEVSRAVRTIKDGQTFVRVTGVASNNLKSEPSKSTVGGHSAAAGFAMTKSKSSVFPTHEEFCLVTVDSLVDACPKMQEEQAMELIEKAVNDYYLSSRGDSNMEEMCHVMRKVNFSTKRLKRHMKASLLEMQKEKEEERLQKLGETQQTSEAFTSKAEEGSEDSSGVVDMNDLQRHAPGFAEMLTSCRSGLQRSRDFIGEEELRDVDISQARYPVEFQPLRDFDDAVPFTIKCVLKDNVAVKAACRAAGIGPENDRLRSKALGKVVRILHKDVKDRTIKCRVPRIGDLWFGLGALCQLRPKTTKDEKKKKKVESGDSGKGSSEGGMSVSSETGHHEEVLRKIYDLETEKRIGQQTVTEAINAVSELKWQQVKEKTERSKLHQKILGLRKKLVSRAREHRRLAQEATRQEERLNILTGSRDEYMELVRSLLEEQRKWQKTLGIGQTLALEDQPSHGQTERDAAANRDVARARERDLALEKIRTENREARADRQADHEKRGRNGRRRGRDAMSQGSAESRSPSFSSSVQGGSDRGGGRHGHRDDRDRRHRDDRPRGEHRHARR